MINMIIMICITIVPISTGFMHACVLMHVVKLEVECPTELYRTR